MARREKPTGVTTPGVGSREVIAGSVRSCATFRGELARHRLVTADGADYVVVTSDERRQARGYVTSAYPVARGYLVMMRQPLCALVQTHEAEALREHSLLVTVLVEAGTAVVRARRRSAAWKRAERRVDDADPMARSDRVRDDLSLPDLSGVSRPGTAVAGIVEG